MGNLTQPVIIVVVAILAIILALKIIKKILWLGIILIIAAVLFGVLSINDEFEFIVNNERVTEIRDNIDNHLSPQS